MPVAAIPGEVSFENWPKGYLDDLVPGGGGLVRVEAEYEGPS